MNLADYEIQNEIANSDSSSDSFWVAKHVMTQVNIGFISKNKKLIIYIYIYIYIGIMFPET